MTVVGTTLAPDHDRAGGETPEVARTDFGESRMSSQLASGHIRTHSVQKAGYDRFDGIRRGIVAVTNCVSSGCNSVGYIGKSIAHCRIILTTIWAC